MNCKNCNKEFEPSKIGRRQLFCNLKCTHQFHNGRKRNPKPLITTDTFYQKCVQLVKEGLSQRQIAKTLKCSQNTVFRSLNPKKEETKVVDGFFSWGNKDSYKCQITGFNTRYKINSL